MKLDEASGVVLTNICEVYRAPRSVVAYNISLPRAIAFSDVQVRGVALFRGTPTSNVSSEK